MRFNMFNLIDTFLAVNNELLGDVMSDLQGRRAIIEGMSSEKGFEVIKAKVPLKEMDKYSTSLSSITGGRAHFTLTFAKYDIVPHDVQGQLLADYEKEFAEA